MPDKEEQKPQEVPTIQEYMDGLAKGIAASDEAAKKMTSAELKAQALRNSRQKPRIAPATKGYEAKSSPEKRAYFIRLAKERGMDIPE